MRFLLLAILFAAGCAHQARPVTYAAMSSQVRPLESSAPSLDMARFASLCSRRHDMCPEALQRQSPSPGPFVPDRGGE